MRVYVMLKYCAMRIFQALLLILLAATAASSAYAADIAAAERAFSFGDWPAAANEYQGLAKADPSADNFNRLGEAAMYNLDFQRAEWAFSSSLKKAETPLAKVMYTMLEALRDQSNMPAFTAMLEERKDDPKAWFAAGFLNVQKNDLDSALKDFQKASELAPRDYMIWFMIGYCNENESRFDDSIKAYKMAEFLNPEYAQAVNNLGYSYKERGYYSYAIEAYRRAIGLMPRNAGFYYNLGNAYTHKHMEAKAFYSYRTAVDLQPNFAKAHYNLGRNLMKMGFYENAIRHMKLYIKYWTPAIPVVDAPTPDNVQDQIDSMNVLITEREDEYLRRLSEDQ